MCPCFLPPLPREHYLYFSDEEVDSERLSYLPKDTRLVSGRTNNLALICEASTLVPFPLSCCSGRQECTVLADQGTSSAAWFSRTCPASQSLAPCVSNFAYNEGPVCSPSPEVTRAWRFQEKFSPALIWSTEEPHDSGLSQSDSPR